MPTFIDPCNLIQHHCRLPHALSPASSSPSSPIFLTVLALLFALILPPSYPHRPPLLPYLAAHIGPPLLVSRCYCCDTVYFFYQVDLFCLADLYTALYSLHTFRDPEVTSTACRGNVLIGIHIHDETAYEDSFWRHPLSGSSLLTGVR
ncbi:hypothetical protein MPH_12948 [Macrophomina phaseolina MS6]|uniref:Uncharacterized protein n=1 Tax=Macrophomina phaseolina (strain MS6) TaxID=1126212 RepID=K2QJE7_MACPH|nr:hypothetical protein MPH_12948 [Macrophomina phaseolina MS6]